MDAHQFWIQAPGQGETVRAELPPRQDGEVLVRTLYSGISRGTEALVFRGEVPPSQYQAMRAPFQEGEFPGPVKYGYCSVGEVREGPDTLVGRAVFCLYPHQDVYVVPATAVTPLPDRLPAGRAVLAANVVGVNAFRSETVEHPRLLVTAVVVMVAWTALTAWWYADTDRRTGAQRPGDEIAAADAGSRRLRAHCRFSTPATCDTFSDSPASWALSVSTVCWSTVTSGQRGDGNWSFSVQYNTQPSP